ncbi:MAG: cell wall-binding repeat-containing protein [Motilibacteraceae bacterium]
MTQNSRGRSFVPTRVAGRVVAAGLSAGLAVSALGVVAATTASATTSVTANRVAGADRYETAVKVSAGTFTSSTNVVIASGEAFPDGLSAAALAGALNAPVLLVPATGSAPAVVKAEVARLGATNVFVVGGTGAVSDATVASLGTGLTANRIGGTDRVDTAVKVAQYIKVTLGKSFGLVDLGTGTALPTAFVARQDNFADALAASAPAASGIHPIFLTPTGTLPQEVESTIAALGIKQVVIMGGSGAVSDAVATNLANGLDNATGGGDDVNVVRLGGADRYETARDLADVLVTNTGFKFSAEGAVIATGQNFPDALAAGPHAALVGSATSGPAMGTKPGYPLLFTTATSVPASTQNFFVLHRPTLDYFTVVGGAGVVSDSVVSQLQAAATVPTAPAPAAANGATLSSAAIASVNKQASNFVAGATPATFTYDSNDLFYVNGTQVSQAAFVAALSTGDLVTVDYRSNASEISVFQLNDQAPQSPTGVSATYVAKTSTAAAKVTVAFTAGATAGDSYKVYRGLSINGTDCTGLVASSYALVGTTTSTSFDDTSISGGNVYCYAVSAVKDGDEGAMSVAAHVSVPATVASDTVAPTLTVAAINTDAGLTGIADKDDVYTLVLSEPGTASATSVIRLKDADGTFADLTATNATFAQAAPDTAGGSTVTVNGTVYPITRVITVTVTGPVNALAGFEGTAPGLGLPATIVNTAGITDTAGNALSLASGDTSIN